MIWKRFYKDGSLLNLWLRYTSNEKTGWESFSLLSLIKILFFSWQYKLNLPLGHTDILIKKSHLNYDIDPKLRCQCWLILTSKGLKVEIHRHIIKNGWVLGNILLKVFARKHVSSCRNVNGNEYPFYVIHLLQRRKIYKN